MFFNEDNFAQVCFLDLLSAFGNGTKLKTATFSVSNPRLYQT